MSAVRLHVFFSGRVQGVGFRYTTKRIAGGFAVTGWVKNLPDGRVELVAEGEQAELERFRAAVREEFSGLIKKTDAAWEVASGGLKGFKIAF